MTLNKPKIKTDIENLETSLGDITNDEYKIYGVYWNKGSSPTLTRIDSAIGYTANAGTNSIPAFNQFDTSSLFKDFQEVTDSLGNVFIRIPKMYIKKEDGTGYKTRQISRKPFPGAYLPWCFWDFTNGRELDYIDVGKYKASLSADNKLESKSNKFPLYNKNIVEFRTYAKANGAGYQQLDIHIVDLLQSLFAIEMATLNSQSKVAGFTSGQWSASHTATVAEANVNRIILANSNADLYQVGQTIGIGTTQGGNQVCSNRIITSIDVYDASNKAISFDGTAVTIAVGNILYNLGQKNGFSSGIAASVGSPSSNTDGKKSFVWHGIESLFGDIWQFIDGVNINNRQAWVCKNAENYASNVFTAPYEQLGYVNGSTEGYVTAMGFDSNLPFAEFPTAVDGGSSTYYSDYYYNNTNPNIALLGGTWNNGSAAGLFCWYLGNASSSASVFCGGRLTKKPL